MKASPKVASKFFPSPPTPLWHRNHDVTMHAIDYLNVFLFYRKYRLYKNEREIVLNYDDHLIGVQLCLAEINKKVLK